MANKFTDAVFHAKVPAVDKAVLWAIAHRTDNATGSCYPSIKTIAKESGASVPVVKKIVAYAASVGLLERKGRRDGNVCLANEYVFSITKLRWLTRADSRFIPNGETDSGVRATVAFLQAHGRSKPTVGVADNPRVGSLPAQGWAWSRLENSEVDLRIGTRHSNSDSRDKTDFTKRQTPTYNPYPDGQPEWPNLYLVNPEIEHDKGCPCYPRLIGICFCGLYEVLMSDMDCTCAHPRPDTNGDSAELYGVSCTNCGGWFKRPIDDDDELGRHIRQTVPGPTDFGGVKAKAAAAPTGNEVPVQYCGLCYKRPCADGEDVCIRCLEA